jgi:hypothetical protein
MEISEIFLANFYHQIMEELTEPDLPGYWLDIRHKACKEGKILFFLQKKNKSQPTLFCFANRPKFCEGREYILL